MVTSICLMNGTVTGPVVPGLLHAAAYCTIKRTNSPLGSQVTLRIAVCA